jgi:hypothetical protein
MTTIVETENADSRIASSDDVPTPTSTDSLLATQGFSGAKRMSPEEQGRFFRNTKNFFEL